MCRGKIASQTQIFNRSAGFHGEFQLRSYLVGELHLDWLDYSNDLIETNRSDILWSDELGEALAEWGKAALKALSQIARNPYKKKAWDTFQATANLADVLRSAFPRDQDNEMRGNARSAIQFLAQGMREAELESKDDVDHVVRLGILLGPLVTVDEELRKAADEPSGTLSALSLLLEHAKVAELTAFGKLAENRVRIIERLQAMTRDDGKLEDVYQELIEGAPWLINPEWAPVTANQSLKTLRIEFEKWLGKQGLDVNLTEFGSVLKRPDFVLTTQEGRIEIVEIKPPGHKLNSSDFKRTFAYHEQMTAFLAEPGNKVLKDRYRTHHITLVCDSIGLTGMEQSAYKKLVDDGFLTQHSWAVFLAKTVQVHQDFLEAADRERNKVVSLDSRRAQPATAEPTSIEPAG